MTLKKSQLYSSLWQLLTGRVRLVSVQEGNDHAS